MQDDAPLSSQSPEPLALLIEVTPAKSLVEIIKADAYLARTVFQGFTPRERSLTQPVVRQRLERELEKRPEIMRQVLERWLDLYADLMVQVNTPDFSPSAESLQPLLAEFGEAALCYGLLHADRDEVREWAERMEDIRAAEPYALVEPAPPPVPMVDGDSAAQIAALQERIIALGRQVQGVRRERDTLQRKTERMERQLESAADMETALRKMHQATEQQLERERRRAKKAEEDAAELRRQAKHTAPPAPEPPPAPPVPAEAILALEEAIRLLQQSISLMQPSGVPAEPTVAAAPPPPMARPVSVKKTSEPAVTLPTERGKRAFTLAQVLSALNRNDAGLVDQVRDGLARLATQPDKERQALAELATAGIPEAVLTGPLRTAVLDGSNIANMSPERRARLAYLQQAQRSAWAEGYFPVIMIVDASLRYQIDQPELLMQMVERGEIQMAPPGTSADELLIEEATCRHAVLVTNDRMADWPAAKTVEKRHIELRRGTARLGAFHHSAWFHW